MRGLKLAVEAIEVSKQPLHFFNELVHVSTALKARNKTMSYTRMSAFFLLCTTPVRLEISFESFFWDSFGSLK
jgi:hypothetical protein